MLWELVACTLHSSLGDQMRAEDGSLSPQEGLSADAKRNPTGMECQPCTAGTRPAPTFLKWFLQPRVIKEPRAFTAAGEMHTSEEPCAGFEGEALMLLPPLTSSHFSLTFLLLRFVSLLLSKRTDTGVNYQHSLIFLKYISFHSKYPLTQP